MPGPADNRCGPYRTLGHFAQFAAKRASIAHVWRALVAEFPRGLAIRSIVWGKDEESAVGNAKFFEHVEDVADVVVPLHHLVAVVANPRLALELTRRQVWHVPHRERQVEEERLPGCLLAAHELDRFVHELVV